MDRKKEVAMSAHSSCLVVYCNSIEANSCFKMLLCNVENFMSHCIRHHRSILQEFPKLILKIGRIKVAFETLIRALHVQTET